MFLAFSLSGRTLDLSHKRHQKPSWNTAIHCNTLQHTATHYNTLQHAATHCNTLQHTAPWWQLSSLQRQYCNFHDNFGTTAARPRRGSTTNSKQPGGRRSGKRCCYCNVTFWRCRSSRDGTRCYTLHHNAEHGSILQHTATHWRCCSSRDGTRCNALHHMKKHCNTL